MKPIDAVRAALERMKPQLEMALPRHLTAERLLRVAMTAVQNTPKLLECDRTSLYAAVMTCAQLGLEPDGILGQAYLVPFAGRVQFIPGYKGLISLARNSGEVTAIAAHEVREGDTFEFDFGSGEPPKHTFDIRKPRGEVIAFYAVAKFRDGGFHWDMMTRDEVDAIRDRSQGYQAALRAAEKAKRTPTGPWAEDYIEMGKKTVIRRIAKYLPMSVQKAAALADAYDTGTHVTLDRHGDLVIEGEATAADPDQTQLEKKQSNLDQFEKRHGGGSEPHNERNEDDPRPRSALFDDPRWTVELPRLLDGSVDFERLRNSLVLLVSQCESWAELDKLGTDNETTLTLMRQQAPELRAEVGAAIEDKRLEFAAARDGAR
ncbi:MAG TPA: recombinase RecT [Stellaceae bacterium]|nr:recombinase RecT [Stellaceae bacterium]